MGNQPISPSAMAILAAMEQPNSEAEITGRDEEAIAAAVADVPPLYRDAIRHVAAGRLDKGREMLAQFHALPETKELLQASRESADQAAAATE